MILIDEEIIKKLEKVLANYPDILSEFGIKDHILKVYKSLTQKYDTQKRSYIKSI